MTDRHVAAPNRRAAVAGFEPSLKSVVSPRTSTAKARETVQTVRIRRDEEDLYVAARDSFDEDAYRKGLSILIGASAGSFFLLALLILL